MENKNKEIVVNQTQLTILQGDITRQSTDAIVNAANSSLMGAAASTGRFTVPGVPLFWRSAKQIVARQGRLPTGKAVITTGGRLKAKYVIHTVGPVWHGGTGTKPPCCASAYQESLKLAAEKKLTSVSFPSISTGAYGYPVDEAARVVVKAVVDFLRTAHYD